MCRVRKLRRAKISNLVSNYYPITQNISYSHEPSSNPSMQRKGEELLIAPSSKVHNTLSTRKTEASLTTLLRKSNNTNLSYSNQAALTALVCNVSLLKLHSLTHDKSTLLSDNSLVAV